MQEFQSSQRSSLVTRAPERRVLGGEYLPISVLSVFQTNRNRFFCIPGQYIQLQNEVNARQPPKHSVQLLGEAEASSNYLGVFHAGTGRRVDESSERTYFVDSGRRTLSRYRKYSVPSLQG